MYGQRMSRTVQIRDLPDEVHKALRLRAAESGLSLSEYLRTELAEVAARPSIAAVLERAAARGGGAAREDILEAVHGGRDHA